MLDARHALLLLFAFFCPAQDVRVTGLVTAFGRPLPGVLVQARSNGELRGSAVTEEDGRFTLPVPPGGATLTAEIFGFDRVELPITAPSPPVEIVLKLSAPKALPVAEEPPPAPSAPAAEPDSESLLVQGSLSRGIDGAETLPPPDDPADMRSELRSLSKGGGKKGKSELAGPGVGGLRAGGKPKKQKKRKQSAAVFGNKTKKRASQIRGSVSLQARNSVFDAAPYALNGQTLAKPAYSQYRYNATVGGPLIIPKLMADGRTQFTLTFQLNRSTNPFTSFSTLPNAAERSGDFSATRTGATIFDPTALSPFPGNQIPASRLSPIARGLLALMPQANQTGLVQNFRVVTTVPQNTHQVSLSVARPIGLRDRLTFQLSWQGRAGVNVQPYGFRDPTHSAGRNVDLRWNHTFSPKLILTAHGRYNLSRTQQQPFFAFQRDVSGELGIAGNSREPINWGPPNLNFTNYGDLQDGAHSDRRIHTFTYGGGVTHVKGRVTTTAGAELVRAQWNTFAEQNARGTLFFGGLSTSGRFNGFPQANTGWDLADFLLGLPQQASLRAGGADTYLRSSTFSAYAQHAIRLTKSLTLNLGHRYEVWRPFTERYNRMVNLDLDAALTRVEPVLPGAAGPFSGAFPRGLVDTDWNNFSPRYALAWKPHKRFTTRAAYGIYMDASAITRLPNRLAAQPPFALTSNFNTSAANPIALANPFAGTADVRVRNTYAVDRHYRMPYAQSWSYAIDLDLPHHLALELSYLGTKGTRLVMQRQPNRAAPGSPANSEDRRRIENAIGFTYDSTEGNSIFHAGQLKFQRKYSKGLAWTALYTFAKSIDNATSVGGAGNVVVQDDRNYAAERGLSSFDRRHSLAFNTTVMSPFGKNGYFLREPENKFARLFESWLLTFATTARSGTPFTARVLGNVADAAGTGATGSGRASATGLPVSGGQWFNTAAFGIPAAGTFGNAGRNTIPGPAFFTASASLGRTFRLGDSTRQRLELRMEAENLLNRVNITGLGVVVNALEYGLATRAAEMRNLSFTARFRF